MQLFWLHCFSIESKLRPVSSYETQALLLDYVIDHLCPAVKSQHFPRVISFSGLLGDRQYDSEAKCCDVRWDSRMDNPSGGTLKRTASSCQPEGASVTSAATPKLCSGRLKICLLALVLLHTVIFISTSHNSTSVGVTAIFSPEESASSDEWTLWGGWTWCL